MYRLATIMFLLFAAVAYAGEYVDWTSSFEQEAEGWEIYRDYEYTTSGLPKDGEYILRMNLEPGEYPIMTYYFDNQHQMMLHDYLSKNKYTYYWRAGFATISTRIVFYLDEDPQRKDYISLDSEKTYNDVGNWKRGECYLYTDLQELLGNEFLPDLCLKRIEVFAEVDSDCYVDIDFFSIEDILWLNPPQENYCEVFLGNPVIIHSGDEMDITLQFYFGYPSQEVNVYWIIYKNGQFLFFPDWTTQVQSVKVFIPQYHRFIETKLKTWVVPERPFDRYGEYFMVMLFQGQSGELLTDRYAVRKILYKE